MHSRIAGSICFVALAVAGAFATTAQESAPVIAVVDAFHAALHRGEVKAATELLAPDAMVLESGSAETRAEYERHHLKEDIAFARAINTTRSVLGAQVDGNVAWVVATSRSKGFFEGREINSSGVELTILTKTSAGWRIRAVHWSSHQMKKTE